MFDLQNACVIIAQAYPDGGEFLRCAFIEWCDVCERQALGPYVSYGDASARTTWAIGTAGCATPGQREGRRQVLRYYSGTPLPDLSVCSRFERLAQGRTMLKSPDFRPGPVAQLDRASAF
jgi:hypothetical protein